MLTTKDLRRVFSTLPAMPSPRGSLGAFSTWSPLDRVGHWRGDPAKLEELRNTSTARFVVMRKGGVLVTAAGTLRVADREELMSLFRRG